MNDRQELYRQGRRAAVWGIGVSLILGATKLVGGLLGHSLALLSDAVHSLVDAAVSSALLAALIMAQRPPDPEHPYGHGRLEAIAGAGVALVLIGLALTIAYESISTISVPSERPAGFTLFIAGATACSQELLSRYVSRVARRTRSRALSGIAWDYRLDALGGIGVLFGVAMARWANWHWADHLAALLVAVTIFWVGGALLVENLESLIDSQAEPEVLAQVRAEAQAVAGVLAVEKLRVRRMGIEHIAEIHVQVDGRLAVSSGHAIAHAVKDQLITSVPTISDVVVHIEPFGGPQGEVAADPT
jgi:cation diffusion facilitator family transporter